MIAPEEIRKKLAGYPEDLLQNYEQFLQGRNPEYLNRFVIGLLRFLQDASESADNYPEDTSLQDDLGVDSITIAEVVFHLEDILEIEINNQDLMRIKTIGDLRSYIMGKLD
jgi:acyl carrier protein